MFSYTHPPGASVAWPPRDERQGLPMPPTRGRPVLGRTSLTKTTEIGTVIRPRRSVTLPSRADGSPSAQRRGVRPRVPFPPDPAPSAHPGVPATNRRRSGVPAGSAPMPVARCAPRARRHEGSRWLTGGVSDRRRRAPHRWRRNHHRDQRRDAATTGTRGAPVDADRLGPDVSRHAITSRQLTRDNCSYRESNGQISVLGR